MKIDVPTGRIGIFISGGLDSAVLYHLLLQENKEVIPLLVHKNPYQQQFALGVIEYLQDLHNIKAEPVLLKSRNIKLAIQEAFLNQFKVVYLGVIKELTQFLVDWSPNNFKETKWVRGPLIDLDKTDIVKLAIENNLQHLFYITHSCAVQETGRCLTCNRCRERAWAFNQLGLTNDGTL